MTHATQSAPQPAGVAFSHLRSSKSSFRLNQIERIRASGVGELVSLPQLAVCGDQSVGKSSVLEGITGIPFPRQEGLCTRFPTEIILRHSNTSECTEFVASIRPHSTSSHSQEHLATLTSYRKILNDISDLPAIIEEVSKLLNIRGYTDADDGRAFASDALRVEVTGPIGIHLSVVDLPGLISVPDDERGDEDVDAVHDMVTGYLQSSRTIILAVIQAGNDMANQTIIKMARKHDPDGKRTVGIITKTDLINKGAEARIAMMAKNEDAIKLKLGFFILKNPSPDQRDNGFSMEQRSSLELRFFATAVWQQHNLDMNRVGADKLRLFLQALLDTHIERELPKLQAELKALLLARETELKALGTPRPTVGHIRAFVTDLSMQFYQLLQTALDGNYHGIDIVFFSEDDSRRLRAQVQKTNTTFASFMREHGQKRKIDGISETSHQEDKSFGEQDQLKVKKSEMMNWVKKAYSRTRGKELPGSHNSALLSELFHEQSENWHQIAQNHVSKIVTAVRLWLCHGLHEVILEERLRMEVTTILHQWVDNAEKLALNELEKLIQDELRGPLTYNHYYTDNVQKERLEGQKAAVRSAIGLVTQRDRNGKLHVSNQSEDIEKFITAVQSKITVDMNEQACNEAMTQLNAYYKVAMKTFVDNVTRQVIERHIMSPLPRAFCPNSVAQLSDEEILKIGSEPDHQSIRRTKIIKEAEDLRNNLSDLQRPVM